MMMNGIIKIVRLTFLTEENYEIVHLHAYIYIHTTGTLKSLLGRKRIFTLCIFYKY